MSARRGSGWVVTCPDHTAGPFGSREVAERQAEAIAALGACGWSHEVTEAKS